MINYAHTVEQVLSYCNVLYGEQIISLEVDEIHIKKNIQ